MHTSGDTATNSVPAFLTKLWTLVDDPSTNELICWDNGGKSFHVLDQARFAKEILPLYFKHNNMASFIRQLNMYGFRKVVRTEPMFLKAEKDDVEFAHQFFVQGQENLLEFIKRKVSGVSKMLEETQRRERGGQVVDPAGNEEDLHRVFVEVNYIKNKQDTMTSKLENLKVENEMLWREVASLRQQHSNQSQVVKKLISFLLSLLGNKRTTISGMKRKIPLMLEAGDSSSSDSAAVLSPPKISRRTAALPRETYHIQSPLQGDTSRQHADDRLLIQEVFEGTVPTITLADSPLSSASAALSTDMASDAYTSMPLEPLALLSDEDIGTNVELTDLLGNSTEEPIEVMYADDDSALGQAAIENDSELAAAAAFLSASCTATQPQLSLLTSSAVKGGGATGGTSTSSGISGKSVWNQKQPSKVTTVALTDPVQPAGDFDKSGMSLHLDTLQANIDSIRDKLNCGQYNFDPSTLFGLFNSDNISSSQPLLYDLGIPGLYEDDPSEHSELLTNFTKPGGIQGNEVIQYVPQDDFSSLFQDISELNTPYPVLDDTEPIYPELSSTEPLLSPGNPLLISTAAATPSETFVSSSHISSAVPRNDAGASAASKNLLLRK